MFEYRPYSKEDQLKGHQKPKDRPKPKEKRPKKKKNPQLYRGRIIPKKKERTAISIKDYKKMIEVFGDYCQECGHVPIAAHHLVFRSSMGTGGWRNLAPLCEKCHSRAHKDRDFADRLRSTRRQMYGAHFGKDKYALFMEGLIDNTTDAAYERFFKKEAERLDSKNH